MGDGGGEHFRKKKGDDGGYNRISRLIEDRRRELDEGQTGEIEEDTIQLGGSQAADTTALDDDEESVSLLSVRTPYRAALPDSEPEPFEADRTFGAALQNSWADSPDAASPQTYQDQTIPARYAAEPEQPARPQPDTMRVPDIGMAGGNVTLVAVEATWEGRLHSDGDIRIEGTLRGELETSATLIVAPQARVHASIRARNIVLAGDVEGDITCEDRLEILPGGSARGQINSARLVVHEGAYIDSRFQMRRDGAEA